MKHLSVLFSFLTLNLFSFGVSVEDSLQSIIQSSKIDSTKALNYCKLSNHFRRVDLEKAVAYSDTSLNYSDKLLPLQKADVYDQCGLTLQSNGDYEQSLESYLKAYEIRNEQNAKKPISTSLNNIGISYYYQGKYKEAMGYFQQAGELKIEVGDSIGAGRAFNNTGIMFDIMGEPAKAVEAYFKALKIYESASRKDMQLGTLMNIGLIYQGQKEFQKALNLYLKSANIAYEIEDQEGIITSWNNAGTALDNLHKYDSAATLFYKALALSQKIGSKRGIALTHNNLAVNIEERGMLDSAIYHYEKALPLKIELGNKSGIAVSQLGLAEVYYRSNQPKKAIEQLEQALANAQETGYVDYIRQSYELLASSHAQSKDYKNAYEYQKLFMQLKDSLLNEENSQIINELNTQYETEKKEQQIAIQQLANDKLQGDNARQRIVVFAAIAGVLLMIVLAVVLYRSNIQKQKTNELLEEKNDQISRQRDEIAYQKRELTDSIEYAKTIQNSILPSQEIIAQAIPNHFVLFQPKDIVSGDFYWFAKVGNTSLIAAVDCTGHGVPGAFVSMVGANLLNQIVIERGITKPGDILFHLNNEVRNVFKKEGNVGSSNDGMDMALCSLEGNKLQYAGAKNPLFLIQNGELAITKGSAHAIGGHSELNTDFKNHEFELGKEDVCYIFSDGFQDQFGGTKGKKFMVKNFKQILSEIFTKPLSEQHDILLQTFVDWKSGYEQIDDLCIVGFKA